VKYCSRKTKTKQKKSLRRLRERRTTIITGVWHYQKSKCQVIINYTKIIDLINMTGHRHNTHSCRSSCRGWLHCPGNRGDQASPDMSSWPCRLLITDYRIPFSCRLPGHSLLTMPLRSTLYGHKLIVICQSASSIQHFCLTEY